MAATTEPVDLVDPPHADVGRERKYVGIAIFLAVVTALEVAATEVGLPSGVMIASLMFMMAVKFWTVAWFFMHLKFDKRLLSAVFYAGLILALLVYLAVMIMFRMFTPETFMLSPENVRPPL